MENEGGIYTFLEYNVHPVSIDSKNEPFSTFVANNKIEIIWVTANILNHKSIVNDVIFNTFIQTPSISNSIRINIANSSNYLLVNRKLMPN